MKLWFLDKLSKQNHIIPTYGTIDLTGYTSKDIHILLEEESTSTRLNAVYTINMLQQMFPNRGSFLVITSTFHQFRSERVFNKLVDELGLQYSFIMVDSMHDEPSANQEYFWREVLGICLYYVMNWI
eukprot:TRINITY_DN4133_c0_g1_i2.p1 TRINITY_DN4133_c0_g1~~TRINITY_DN4133_c0_g1_i2.p1  ORF type:complete len:127 (+),score=13.89 TRINITY_DN4133_c0_g1_i2:302-682(+)